MTRTGSGRILLLLAISAALAACGTKPRPPVFNLYVHAKVAALPFLADPADPAIAADLEAALVGELHRLDAAPVVEAPPAAVGAPAAAGASPWTDPAWRAGIREATGCDLVLAGGVSGYERTVESEEPRRIKSRLTYGWRWGFTEQARVHLEAFVQLVDARTGIPLWTRRAPADGRQGRWTELDWPGESSSAPEGGWADLKARAATGAAPGAEEALARSARAEAIAEAVRTLSADFLGRDGWEPPARPGQEAAIGHQSAP